MTKAGMQDLDDAALIVAVRQELLVPRTPLTLICAPATVFELVGLLQLALRYPGIGEMDAAARFVVAAQRYFADCPAVSEALRRGGPTQH